jgi:hypothetical protein
MLILRGLLVAFAGFAFIFLPGAIISIPTRRGLRFESNNLLWGMAVLVVGLFPAMFLTSLVRMIIFGERFPESATLAGFSLVASLIAALFIEGGIYLVLRLRKIPPSALLSAGIMLGLGVGLLTNVFQGISLVGGGFRLVFGDTATPDLARLASQPWFDLVLSLLALNTYRIAAVALSAALGGLVARTLVQAQPRWFWLAVLIQAIAAWSYSAIGAALGNDTRLGLVAALVLEAAVAALALYWLTRQPFGAEVRPAR